MELEFQIVRDAETDLPPDSSRRAILLGAGLRSSLRFPVRLEGKIVGALSFHSTATGRYGEEDVELAGRVADQVALAFSHQRLAEEAKKAEEARREAARLEARVRRSPTSWSRATASAASSALRPPGGPSSFRRRRSRRPRRPFS